MATFRFNPTAPIPNNPFYAPTADAISSSSGPLVAGSGIIIDYATGTISATGGGGGGGVTQITVTGGLSGGIITSTGTISMPNVVTGGTYAYPSQLTLDSKGRVTAISPGTAPLTGIACTFPIQVSTGATPNISVAQATTTTLGVTQLYDGLNSTSTTSALTAAQGKILQQQIAALGAAGNLTLAGTFNATASAMTTVSSDGGSAGFTIGGNLPAPGSSINNYFVIVTTPGSYSPPGGGGPYPLISGDWLLCNGSSWEYLAVGVTAPYASTTAAGIACLATNAQAIAGTNTTNALTPAAGAAAYVPKACYNALGTLVAGTPTAGTPIAISLGSTGDILTADVNVPGGVKWAPPATSGTVTCILTCCGITGGPITSTGTICLTTTGVTAGTYTNATITVDAYGRLTSAGNGTSSGIPCSAITGKGALISGTAASTPTAIPVGATGQVLTVDPAAATGLAWKTPTSGGVTSINVGTGLSGGPTITTTGTIALANTTVVAGCYTNATICVDAQGRLTSAACGTSPVTSITVGTGLTGGPVITSTGTIALANTTVAAGCYTNATICVDAQGRLTAASCGAAPVTAVTGTAPICVTTGTTPVVCINPASTTACGAVQLYNGVDSQSVALALTACQGKVLQDQINSLNAAGGLTLAGTFNAATSQMLTVTSSGSGAGFAIGSNLPTAAAGNTDFFVIVTVGGTYTPPGGTSTVASQGDWYLSSGTAWEFLNVGPSFPYASDTAAGIVCLATNALAQSGTDTLTALTPASAASAYIPRACLTAKGALVTASAACAPVALAAGTNGQYLVACSTATSGLCWISPVSATTTTPGIVQLATNAETLTGTDTAKAVTPSGLFFAANCCFVPKACITAKGALITGTAASTPTALALGGTGQVLTVDPACTTGLKWATPAAASAATPIARGTVFGCTTAWDSGNLWGEVSLGNCAYAARTTGTGNTAVGASALRSNTDGYYNTVLGNFSGGGIVSGNNNTLLGANAASYNDFCDSVVIGFGAVSSNVITNDRNVIIGSGALSVAGSGSGFSNSIIIGYGAGGNLADSSGCNIVLIGNGVYGSGGGTASDQLAIGCGFRYWLTGDSNYDIRPGNGILDCTGSPGTAGQALVSLGNVPGYGNRVRWCSLPGATSATTGFGGTAQGIMWGCTTTGNTALGFNSLGTGITGNFNVSVGVNALSSITTGSRNVVLGVEAGRAIDTGTCNTALGYLAGSSITSGWFNVAVGNIAGCSITTGCSNVLIGQAAGCTITTGFNNVAIGPNATVASGSASCQLAIGFSTTCNWLTGDSSKHIRPGAGIRDCNGNLGTAGQFLCSTGTAIVWANTASVGPGLALACNLSFLWGATTTAPSGYGGIMGMYCRQAGDKYYQIQMTLCKSAGGNAGAGDYLFTLPNGLQFGSGPNQTAYTANIGTNTLAFMPQSIPGSTGFLSDGSTTCFDLVPVVYSATQFRVITIGGGGVRPWNSGWFAASSAICMSMDFQFVST